MRARVNGGYLCVRGYCDRQWWWWREPNVSTQMNLDINSSNFHKRIIVIFPAQDYCVMHDVYLDCVCVHNSRLIHESVFNG